MDTINPRSLAINIIGARKYELEELYEYLNKACQIDKCELQRPLRFDFIEGYFDLNYRYLTLNASNRWLASILSGRTLISIEQFLRLDVYNLNSSSKVKIADSKNIIKDMTIFKKYKLEKVKRTVTICVTIEKDGMVKAGYAVLAPGDKYNEDLSKKISLGRAKADRTNLVEMLAGYGMDKKYILYAIADNLAKQIDNGKIVIKGIKDTKESKKDLIKEFTDMGYIAPNEG